MLRLKPILALLGGLPLLARLVVPLTGLIFAACDPFHDSLEELDPALRDSTLAVVPASEPASVARLHILESFGSYGCVSCPEAESRLSPYMHAGSPGYRANLVVINYHVKFGTIADPWVTPAIQAWNDKKGYVSLPQAVMDGSNAAYAVREKDVSFRDGEYDSLAARAGRSESPASIDLRIDTAGIAYDTSAGRVRFAFSVRNLAQEASGPLEFRALVVKNKPAVIPIYPTPWEAIVVETEAADASGNKLFLTRLESRTSKTFQLEIAVPSEAGKHVRQPPLGPETLPEYALLVLAQGPDGRVVNVVAYQYGPKRP
jgi:hypothetical protein